MQYILPKQYTYMLISYNVETAKCQHNSQVKWQTVRPDQTANILHILVYYTADSMTYIDIFKKRHPKQVHNI